MSVVLPCSISIVVNHVGATAVSLVLTCVGLIGSNTVQIQLNNNGTISTFATVQLDGSGAVTAHTFPIAPIQQSLFSNFYSADWYFSSNTSPNAGFGAGNIYVRVLYQ